MITEAAFGAIVFDKDGTLFDCRYQVHAWARGVKSRLQAFTGGHRAGHQAMMAVGFDSTDNRALPGGLLLCGSWESCNAQVAHSLVRHSGLKGREALELADAWHADMDLDLAAPPFADLPELFAVLRHNRPGLRLAICTSDSRGNTTAMLKANGVATEELDLISCSDDPGTLYRKPDPLLARAICDDLGMAPSRVVFVGDSEYDVEMARGAECGLVVLVDSESADAELRAAADVVVESVSDLTEIF